MKCLKSSICTGTTLHGGFPKFFHKSLHFSIRFPKPIHNWMVKKGRLSFWTFYNHTSKSPLILHALTKTWYRSIKESLFSLNINTSLQLTPIFPSLFHEIYPLDDLDFYWQHNREVCANAGISLAARTSLSLLKWGQPMKCLHVASRCPNRGEGRDSLCDYTGSRIWVKHSK